LWITELSWDSNPPNPNGLSPALQAEYLEGALHVLWKQGTSLITWWNVRDDVPTPRWISTLASGIYYASATPSQDVTKSAYTADSFPFHRLSQQRHRTTLGHGPNSRASRHPGRGRIDRTTVTTLQAGQNRIFSGSLFFGVGTNLRAVCGPAASNP
jgi:hypothetical protein